MTRFLINNLDWHACSISWDTLRVWRICCFGICVSINYSFPLTLFWFYDNYILHHKPICKLK
jgi:hypothetical protein